MEAHLHTLIAWLSAHPVTALAVIFAAALLESLALIGAVIPGSTIVFIGGVLVGLKALDPWLAFAAAVVGAIAGDASSYELGRHYRGQIRRAWPLRTHPGLLARGEAYFARNGGRSVFLGRFIGPVRAIVPVIAGMTSMRPWHFFSMNVLSALGWALAHMLPGVLFGASLQVAGAVSSRLALVIALLVIVVWLVAYVIRLVARHGAPLAIWLRDTIVRRARAGRGPVARAVLALTDPTRRESTTLLISALLLVGAAWLFLVIVRGAAIGDPMIELDRPIYQTLQSLRTRYGDLVMITVSELGGAYVMAPVVLVVSIWLLATRRLRTLEYWLAAVGFAAVAVLVLRYALGPLKLAAAYAGVDTQSLPSGDATISMTVFGYLASLLGRGKTGAQKGMIALPATLAVLAIAFSRLYLGAYWFSDIVASLALGLAWVALLTIASTTHIRERPPHTLPLGLAVIATVAVAGSFGVAQNLDVDLARYARPTTMNSMSFEAWQSGSYASIAAARSELKGEGEEPFPVQWAAPRSKVIRALLASGWRMPPAWETKSALLWLVPSTPIKELPVLPKFHHGEPPALTLVRPINDDTRAVLRLWQVAEVADMRVTVPLFVVMATTENLNNMMHLVLYTRTAGDYRTPLVMLEHALGGERVRTVAREGIQARVRLVW
ncbi:MAG: VTT domain-containing protein [Casimicrobiaceae bacterium]